MGKWEALQAVGRVPAAIASAGGKYHYMFFSIPTDALLQNSLLNHLMCSQGVQMSVMVMYNQCLLLPCLGLSAARQ